MTTESNDFKPEPPAPAYDPPQPHVRPGTEFDLDALHAEQLHERYYPKNHFASDRKGLLQAAAELLKSRTNEQEIQKS